MKNSMCHDIKSFQTFLACYSDKIPAECSGKLTN